MQTNESKVRLIAFFVLLLVILYQVTNIVIVPFFLVIDFSFRSFNLGKYSPLAFVSDRIVKIFKLPVKPVYLPPKRFAAMIGLAFSIGILVLRLLEINTIIISSVLAFFAALESLLGFCAGCYVYNFLQRFKK
ncbi:MAG: DUF4395 domain-containing protein [Ferruginibacter sp.]